MGNFKFQILNFKFFLFLLLATCTLLLVVPTFAQADIIPSARISPASPLYFLISAWETFELKWAKTADLKVDLYLKFSNHRLQEVKSLGIYRQDLIQPTLEKDWAHLEQLLGLANLKDEKIAGKTVEVSILHMSLLNNLYPQLSNPSALRSVRTTIYRLSQWDDKLISKLKILGEESSAQTVLTSNLLGCQFLEKEASSSALNEIEKSLFTDRATDCFKGKN